MSFQDGTKRRGRAAPSANARARTVVVALAALTTVLSVSAAVAETEPSSSPRAVADRPDLSGVWDFSTLIPLERPEEMSGRDTLTEEEASALEEKALEAAGGLWSERAKLLGADRRTALILDPPDGRLPPTRPGVEIQELGQDRETVQPVRIRVGGLGTGGPENRGLSERCLLGFNAGPPLTPGFYNQNVRLMQTTDWFVIHTEMVHEARIVPIDLPPGDPRRLPPGIHPWMGASLARWEGDTLVVETTRFKDRVGSFSPTPFLGIGSAKEMRLVERFRLIDEQTLEYTFTVDDPATYARPFTVVLRMTRAGHRIYEFACHEGNRPLRNILAIARALERAEAEP